ncbi:MAG: hypothetical protein U9O94_05100 [Nanoarchaeota archaeon]|nr:hypothetical protein [Nanoarchaeota archaeon]
MAYSFDKANQVITVSDDVTDITIQELLNAIREYEDEVTNMEIGKIVNAAGKEPLGGGVLVGITITLLEDWQVAFAARSGPTYTQCTITGGNLVATNTNGAISPTAFTQVVTTSSASATLQEADALQYASYGGEVSIDITSSNSGTAYPVGNQEYPVNNLADAVSIANTKGFIKLAIRSSMTLATEDVSNFTIAGHSHVDTSIVIESSLSCVGLAIYNCKVSGVLDGGTHIDGCTVGNITYVNGHIHRSGLYGTIYLDGNVEAVLLDCSTIDQDSPPIIDLGGSGQDLAMPNYSGIVTIQNLSSATEEVGIGLNAGHVILDSTITAGNIIISGIGTYTDNSSGAVINVDALLNKNNIAGAVWDSLTADHTITGSTGEAVAASGGGLTTDEHDKLYQTNKLVKLQL